MAKSRKVLVDRGFLDSSADIIESILNILDAPSAEERARREDAFTFAWGRTPVAALHGIEGSLRSATST